MKQREMVEKCSKLFDRIVKEVGEECFKSRINRIWITGEIEDEFKYSHKLKGITYFRMTVKVIDETGKEQVIPVITSSEIFEVMERDELTKGSLVEVGGQIRNVNIRDNKNIIQYVDAFIFPYYFKLCNSVADFEIEKNVAVAYLKGFVTKVFYPVKMPNGETYVDIIVSDSYKGFNIKAYLTEREAQSISLGNRISLWGRIENRDSKMDLNPSVIPYNNHIRVIKYKIFEM